MAFKALEERNIKFVIVGKKEGFITGDTKIIELVKDINLREERVIFTGNIDDIELYEWYKDAKALIFPSFYEGFGMPIIEANVTGRVVLTSRMGAIPEIAGDAVYYVDPHDINDIRKGFLLLIKNVSYRNSLIEKGRINAKRFTVDKMINSYSELYTQLAK